MTQAASAFATLDDLRGSVGRQVFLSDWVRMDQKRIDLWIHVDPERAARSSSFGGTIAHGFLTLSLLGKFYEQFLSLPFCEMGINYGLNKVRFTQPVRAGGQVRGRFVLSRLDELDGGLQLTFGVTLEIEGSDKPACIAESVVRQYFRTA